MPKPAPNLVSWATSLSGCDGGNPRSPVWFSGIEWGISLKYEEEYYQNILPQEICAGEFFPSEIYDWDSQLKYRYNVKLAKLYRAIKGDDDPKNYREILKRTSDYPLFKANLYPIAFNSTDDKLWEKHNLAEITGFKEKQLFKTWCFLHRFPAFAEKVNTYKPKLIIGTGVSYLTDFFVCFAGQKNLDSVIQIGEIIDQNNGWKRRYYWSKLNEETTLVVVPFFLGASGLNSDSLIQEMGKKIRKLEPNLVTIS